MNAGQPGFLYPDFTPFTVAEIEMFLGLFIFNGLSPSPRIDQNSGLWEKAFAVAVRLSPGDCNVMDRPCRILAGPWLQSPEEAPGKYISCTGNQKEGAASSTCCERKDEEKNKSTKDEWSQFAPDDWCFGW
jgi:hypothetical protein